MKVHQDTQFIATHEKITTIMALYDLTPVSYGPADSGIENCTLIVQAPTAEFVLRVYRQNRKSDAAIQAEIDFITYLERNGIPVAAPLINGSGEYLSHLLEDGYQWQVILMKRMPGEHPEHYPDGLLKNLATIQAHMHNLAAAYESKIPVEAITELRETQFITLIQNRAALDVRRQAFIARAEKYVVSLDAKLPKGLCHLDFDNGNVLSEHDNIVAVLDFDDLTIAPYVMCLAYTIWDVAYDGGVEKALAYVATYETIRPLTAHEKRFLAPIMLFRNYVIGCKDIADDQMNDDVLEKYLELEQELPNFRMLP